MNDLTDPNNIYNPANPITQINPISPYYRRNIDSDSIIEDESIVYDHPQTVVDTGFSLMPSRMLDVDYGDGMLIVFIVLGVLFSVLFSGLIIEASK